MNLRILFDIICVLPFILIAPFALVWFLPWEAWVLKHIPARSKKFIGPYWLYLSFSLWHFKFHWWSVALTFAAGAIVCAGTLLNLLFPNLTREKGEKGADQRVQSQ